ncbi:MAG TPA: class I mannose-6-phosphate isomerase [Terriglobales bacterium]|nr:class I mannose-6-phosphate isomerase [Terriglobales bacterium]
MYDKFPYVQVSSRSSDCSVGWTAIAERLRPELWHPRVVVCVECYPGAFVDEIATALTRVLQPSLLIRAEQAYRTPEEMAPIVDHYLGDDPVFGRMNGLSLEDFLDGAKVREARCAIENQKSGVIVVIGTAAALVAAEYDVLIYTDMARWEIQRRQRHHLIDGLAAKNRKDRPSLQYKRTFFVDWRAADRLKKKLLPAHNYLLDTNDPNAPKLISGEAHRDGLRRTAHRPFRVVPYFDPGPWGGHWMEEVCGLPKDKPNHAWCFDCVPEENSLLLGFGDHRVEVPSINVVFSHPRELLGDPVHARFGTEFPIRFDFLDTMGGGNLSLQVHPLTEYIQDKFGMNYTQDESYYLLDAGSDGCVYLGLREQIDSVQMIAELEAAQEGGAPFDADKFINKFPAKKHDHFLIPAGTVHCSATNSMVLEISATPYIFTFKLWDWGRLGLDGRPRPIHLKHGAANIQWDRTTDWVSRNLVNRISPIAEGSGWREERTGLHEREFIETRRHWFTASAPHHTGGGVNVLNLVEGAEAVVESSTGTFEPFVVHYAETFIIPASVGEYTIKPHGPSVGKECGTIKAFVRTKA